jgi:hypothetical protein
MNRLCRIFSQLLQLFPRADFQQAVRKSKAERHARVSTSFFMVNKVGIIPPDSEPSMKSE